MVEGINVYFSSKAAPGKIFALIYQVNALLVLQITDQKFGTKQKENLSKKILNMHVKKTT